MVFPEPLIQRYWAPDSSPIIESLSPSLSPGQEVGYDGGRLRPEKPLHEVAGVLLLGQLWSFRALGAYKEVLQGKLQGALRLCWGSC